MPDETRGPSSRLFPTRSLVDALEAWPYEGTLTMTPSLSGHVPELAAAAVVLLSLALGFFIRRSFFGRLGRLVEKTPWMADDALIASLKRPLPLWFFLGGLYLASRIVAPPPEVAPTLEKLLESALILSLTWWTANLASRLLEKGVTPKGALTTPATGVVRQAARVAVLTVGILVLLSTLGISIAPVLTTVGIGGLAVGLGLQETLSNLFAGMQLTVAGTIRVGDLVRLETGEEGYIEDIQWHGTRVRTLPNNSVVIPNSRLVKSVVTNYHLPTKEIAVGVELGVDYSSDLEQVERVTLEVARAILKTVPGAIPDFEPSVRFHRFGESSIDLSVGLKATELTASSLLKHEFIKALMRAYAAEGIVIPCPVRTVHLDHTP